MALTGSRSSNSLRSVEPMWSVGCENTVIFFPPTPRQCVGVAGPSVRVELHLPQWRIAGPAGPTAAPATSDRSARHPDRVVFDMDPGPGAGLAEEMWRGRRGVSDQCLGLDLVHGWVFLGVSVGRR